MASKTVSIQAAYVQEIEFDGFIREWTYVSAMLLETTTVEVVETY